MNAEGMKNYEIYLAAKLCKTSFIRLTVLMIPVNNTFSVFLCNLWPTQIKRMNAGGMKNYEIYLAAKPCKTSFIRLTVLMIPANNTFSVFLCYLWPVALLKQAIGGTCPFC